MQRRRLLQLGIGAAAVLAVAGGSLAWVKPGIIDGHLTPSGREVFDAVARAVLDGALPAPGAARDEALRGHAERLDQTLAALPGHMQAELSQGLALLASPPGRLGLAGLPVPWAKASVAQLQSALQGMRTSSLAARQQLYHALRDLTNAAYFSDPSTWGLLGYPGPATV